jgi:hypothetical protein
MFVQCVANAPPPEGLPHIAVYVDKLFQAYFLMLFVGSAACMRTV